MTIQEVVSKLQSEKLRNLPSRFPCRAIMVKTIEQYCELLSELKKISDIRVVKSNEIFSSADVLPEYSNLIAPAYQNEWVILTGVGEYLRLFSRKEAVDNRFLTLWSHQAPASSLGRIIIPLWGCEAQWFDPALNLNNDPRRPDDFYNCMEEGPQKQEMDLLVLSGMFEHHISDFQQGDGTLCTGLQEWFEYWENPLPTNTRFVLLTRRFKSITPVSGEMNIHVVNDTLTFIQENMPGGKCLTKDNCSEEMQTILFAYALQGTSLDDSLLKILNVSSFSGVDIMGKWNALPLSHKRFVKLWLQIHPGDSYLSYCFSSANSVVDVPTRILHEIFAKRVDKPDWVKEFKKLISVMMIKPDPAYFEAVDAIPEFEKRLDYITSAMREERIYLLKMVGQWMRKDAEQASKSKKMKEAYPALAAYLSHDLDALQNETGSYLSRYKAHKLENSLPSDEELYFGGVDAAAFAYRYALLSEYEDGETIILWVDALGAEWLSLLCWSIANNCDATITKAALAQATLPTETEFNNQWDSMTLPNKKLNKLDKLAHRGVVDEPDYYACIEEQMNFVMGISDTVSSLLKNYHRVVVTGDHGTSRLAARFFHTRDGIEAPQGALVYSYGRYCELPKSAALSLPNLEIVKGSQEKRFAVFRNYDHFKQSGFAAGAEDDRAIYGEVHGGATPEEMLVPVVVVEGNEDTRISASWEKQTVKISMRKAKLIVSFSKPIKTLAVKMAGVSGTTAKDDVGKTWSIVFSGVKAGTYTVEMNADGRIVSLPDITLLSALGSGDGDLP